ncbi:hypothetical protein ElyMa_006497800 [Elysia marginata]|uniref:Uncharacterized protein n=1 Tax=Elysia marginata TaxID=1093978 RepID=A0AAV4I5Z4_9GAST|nr:hypothetical protein ElyMa_006497800 [Elysia marginata]
MTLVFRGTQDLLAVAAALNTAIRLKTLTFGMAWLCGNWGGLTSRCLQEMVILIVITVASMRRWRRSCSRNYNCSSSFSSGKRRWVILACAVCS